MCKLMESGDALDMDLQYDLWESELVEDGARKDVMPPSLPPPIGMHCWFFKILCSSVFSWYCSIVNYLWWRAETVSVVRVSFKRMLSDVLKDIQADAPRFRTWYRYLGFFSEVVKNR